MVGALEQVPRFALLVTAALILLMLPARADVLITIDKSAQRLTVAVDGEIRWRWPVSTGARSYDTPNGSYTAFRLEKDYFSKEWDNAPMPIQSFLLKGGTQSTAATTSIWENQYRMAVCGCIQAMLPNSLA